MLLARDHNHKTGIGDFILLALRISGRFHSALSSSLQSMRLRMRRFSSLPCSSLSTTISLIILFGVTAACKSIADHNGSKVDMSVVAVARDSAVAVSGSNPDRVRITGLVIDHTISSIGRNFVYLFNQSWNPPKDIGNYTIVIDEKPLPTLGTLIMLKINGNYVFKRFIQPRYDAIRVVAQQAAALALSYVENYKQIQKQLEGEDMKGTGIY